MKAFINLKIEIEDTNITRKQMIKHIDTFVAQAEYTQEQLQENEGISISITKELKIKGMGTHE